MYSRAGDASPQTEINFNMSATETVPVLKIASLAADVVKFYPPVPLQSARDEKAWTQIVTDFLEYAFAGRAVCFVADKEHATCEWADGITERSEVSSPVGDFMLLHVGECDPELLRRFVAANDFWWDAVWLVPMNECDERCAREIVEALDDADESRVSGEVLLTINDGCGVWWLHPSKPLDEITVCLEQSARRVGWQLQTTQAMMRGGVRLSESVL